MIITHVDICNKYYGSEEVAMERDLELSIKKHRLKNHSEAFYAFLTSWLEKEPDSPYYLDELFNFHIRRFELNKARLVIDRMEATGLFTKRMINGYKNDVEMKDYNSCMQVYLKMFFSDNRKMKKLIPPEYFKEIDDTVSEWKINIDYNAFVDVETK